MRDEDIDLQNLARLLRSRSLPTQVQIAKDIGSDQGFVARAKLGQIKRVTPRVRKLQSYVNMRLEHPVLPASVSRSVRAYLKSGGDPSLVVQQMELLTAAHKGRRQSSDR